MSKTYILKTINDIRMVPVEKRAQCVKELRLSMAMADLAEAGAVETWEWTDDGDMSSQLCDLDGKPVMSMEVRPA